jgi:hypothetical protein
VRGRGASVAVGGKGGKGGDGGPVTVGTDGGGLRTLGKESPAIHAQSVGGGGGHGGFAVSAALGPGHAGDQRCRGR